MKKIIFPRSDLVIPKIVKPKLVIPTATDDAVDVDHEEESDCQGEDKSDVHQLNQNGSVILLFKTFIRRH